MVLDYLQDLAEGSTLYGFRGGPAGIMKCKYVELTSDYIYPYRNQVYFSISVVLTQFIFFIVLMIIYYWYIWSFTYSFVYSNMVVWNKYFPFTVMLFVFLDFSI